MGDLADLLSVTQSAVSDILQEPKERLAAPKSRCSDYDRRDHEDSEIEGHPVPDLQSWPLAEDGCPLRPTKTKRYTLPDENSDEVDICRENFVEVHRDPVASHSLVTTEESLEIINAPKDSLKHGVFVSPYTMQHAGKRVYGQPMSPVTSASKKTVARRKGEEGRKIPKVRGKLQQGKSSEGWLESVDNTDEVIAMKMDNKYRKEDLFGQLKRVSGGRQSKKMVMPCLHQEEIVNSSVNPKNVTSAQDPESKDVPRKNSPELTEPKEKETCEQVADTTAKALGPFIQIQNALEGQIASFLKTMKSISEAEKDAQLSEQERRLQRIERRLANFHENDGEPLVNDPQAWKSGKRNQISLAHQSQSQMHSLDALGNNYGHTTGSKWRGERSSGMSRVASSIREYQWDTSRDLRQQYESSHEDPVGCSQTSSKDVGQLTRSNMMDAKSKDGATVLSSHISSCEHKTGHTDINDKSREYGRVVKARQGKRVHKRVAFEDQNQRDAPVSPVMPASHNFDLATPDSTSTTESSILETPMPRHRAPVPAHVSKSVSSRRTAQKGQVKSQMSEKGFDLLRTILKESNHSSDEVEEYNRSKTSTQVSQTSTHSSSARKEGRPGHPEEDATLKVFKREIEEVLKDTELLRRRLQDVNKDIENGLGLKVDERPKKKGYGDPVVSSIQMDSPSGKLAHVDPVFSAVSQGIGQPYHPMTATTILEDVAAARKKLENNMESVIRTRDQSRLYEILELPSKGVAENIVDLKRKVDKKIREISAEVEREMKENSDGRVVKKTASKEAKIGRFRSAGLRKELSGLKEGSTLSARTKKNPKEKVNRGQQVKNRNDVKQTRFQETPLVIRPPHLERSYKSSIYGAPIYFPHRTTTRPDDFLKYISTTTTDKPAATVQFPRKSETEQQGHASPHADQRQRYVFHEERDSAGSHRVPPLHGSLVSIAIPLGKPRQDSSERLPLPPKVHNSDDEDQDAKSSEPTPVKKIAKDHNVAVITIDATDADYNTSRLKKRKKKQIAEGLAIQKVPPIDIESLDDEYSIASVSEENIEKPAKKTVDVMPPEAADYDELQNFLSVQEVEPGELKGDPEETSDQIVNVSGFQRAHDAPYHGPKFPPTHPAPDLTPSENLPLYSVRPIQDRAEEWLEQEILARIVASMSAQPPDPALICDVITLNARADDASEDSEVEEDIDTKTWIDNLIGAQGLQLFVDAGIPINDKLIQDLIKDVVNEILDILFGYPKTLGETLPEKEAEPNAVVNEENKSPYSTPALTPVYTPPGSAENSEIKTPEPSSTETSTAEITQPLKEEEPVEELEYRTPKAPSPVEIVQTPPQTPSAHSEVTPKGLVTTPDPSLKDDPLSPHEVVQVPTPEHSSQGAKPHVDLPDFELTEESSPSTRMSKEELALPASQEPSSRTKTPEPKSAKSSDWSVSSPTYTFNSSTPQSSALGVISEGELINPAQATSGPYSEGEFPISQGQILPELKPDEVEEMEIYDARKLLRKLRGNTTSKADTTSEEQLSPTESFPNTMRETEEIDEDTFSAFSKSEGEVLAQDPVLKFLQRINTPPEVHRITNSIRSAPLKENFKQEKSEGEFSFGENYSNESMEYFQGTQPPSLSLGEVRVNQELLRKSTNVQAVALKPVGIPFEKEDSNRSKLSRKHAMVSTNKAAEKEAANAQNERRTPLQSDDATGSTKDEPSQPQFPKVMMVSSTQDCKGTEESADEDLVNGTKFSGISERGAGRTELLLTVPSVNMTQNDALEASLADITDDLGLEGSSDNEPSSISETQL